jgi:uncharacterized protein YbjT (DUF2867 family)
MKVLVLGATGLIGSAVLARLAAEGHEVVAAARHPPAAHLSGATWIRFDLSNVSHSSDWRRVLTGIDAVVNCVGVLQDGPAGSTEAVHASGPAALFEACRNHGVRRVVHLSAVGVDRATPSQFSRTKLKGDEALMSLDLDWVILRPSVVVGRAAYGGSALIRGLAAWSLLPVMPQTAPLHIVHLDDLVRAIVFFVRPDSPSRVAVEVVGPKPYAFEDAVAVFRQWMHWRPAHRTRVPIWLASIAYRLGDIAGWFGWQPPVRSTAQNEMVRGAIGDPSRLTELTGIKPVSLEAGLAREPVSVQERWFARLYLLKPLVFGVFALFWISTGIVSLGPGRERGIELVMSGGTSHTVALLATLSGGLADTVIGILIAFRRTCRIGLYAAFVISITYATIGTILVPWLWYDPLGPMLKISPIIVLNLVALAILDDR